MIEDRGVDGPLMVLVRPQMAENIGAAARAMRNFGLTGMRLIAPRDGWPNPKAVAMASGAGAVLEQAGLFSDTAAAIADCHRVYATTARARGLVKPVMTPEAAMAEARGLVATGKRVAVLFGPERAGLENDDLIPAQAIVTVPSDPAFFSLNLAQCVLLLAYEYRRAGLPAVCGPVADAAALAQAGEVAVLGDHLEEKLDSAGFFFPPGKAPGMKRNLRAMLARWELTHAEVQTLHGILRQLARRA